MMLTINWSGHAVGENRRKEFSRRLGRAYPNPRYVAFKADLAWTIRLAALGVRLVAPRVTFLMDAPRLDVDALVKPVLDAVQESGLVANDRAVIGQGSERGRLRDDWRDPARGPHYLRIMITGELAGATTDAVSARHTRQEGRR